MNLLMQGAFDPNRPVRSIPTSKNSAVASVFGPEVLSWVDHGSVEIGPVFDLAQIFAVSGATVQSAPPVLVMFITPSGAPLVLEQATDGSCNSQRPKSPAPLFAKRSNPP